MILITHKLTPYEEIKRGDINTGEAVGNTLGAELGLIEGSKVNPEN
jgi:hypothetical protein